MAVTWEIKVAVSVNLGKVSWCCKDNLYGVEIQIFDGCHFWVVGSVKGLTWTVYTWEDATVSKGTLRR